MSRRWLWVLVGVGVAVLLAAGPVYWHVRVRMALEKYRKELRAKGEKLTIQELVHLPPTNGYNGWARFSMAAPQITGIPYQLMPSMMRHISAGGAWVSWKNGTNDWAGLKTLLDQKEQAFVEVRASLEAPWFHAELNYEDGAFLLLPHLATMKSAAQGLIAKSALDFHEGKPREGKTNLLSSLRMAKLCCNEPVMISQLVKIAIEALAWNATWEALQYPGWQESEVAELQHAWEALDKLQLMQDAVAMERAMGSLDLQKLREGDDKRWSNFSGGGGTTVSSILDDIARSQQNEKRSFMEAAMLRIFGKTFWKWWWSYEEELEDAKVFQGELEALRKVERSPGYFEPVKQLEAFGKKIFDNPRSKICFWMSQSTEKFCTRIFAGLAKREMLITAMALKRYHLRHGKYPTQLTQLVPEFLSKAPVDWVNGEALRYRLKDDQHFLLYSIGEDGKDDGGDSSLEKGLTYWWRSKDWVYPEPATDEEVAEYLKAEAAKGKKRR